VYELILVDDGSTDGSGDILKEYEKDPRVKVIYQENQGIGLPEDERFYIVLLKHLSAYYYPKIRGLNDEMVDALFVLAQELLTEYKPLKPYRLPMCFESLKRRC